jgi:hypothetical protein
MRDGLPCSACRRLARVSADVSALTRRARKASVHGEPRVHDSRRRRRARRGGDVGNGHRFGSPVGAVQHIERCLADPGGLREDTERWFVAARWLAGLSMVSLRFLHHLTSRVSAGSWCRVEVAAAVVVEVAEGWWAVGEWSGGGDGGAVDEGLAVGVDGGADGGVAGVHPDHGSVVT